MIIIIDPLITGFSHEMVNAGFVYSIANSNKEKKILFIAEEKHIECIKNIFELYNYNPKNIEYLVNNNFIDFIKNNWMLRKYSNDNAIKQYIFLSFDALTVSLIYRFIKKTPVYLVSHAIFEQLIDNENKRGNIPRSKKDTMNKLKNMSFLSFIKLLYKYIGIYFDKYYNIIKNKLFNFNDIFLNQSRENVTYITLSKHIEENLIKHNVQHKNNIKTFTMPYILPRKDNIDINEKLNNFGVIGYGNPLVMKEIIENINSVLPNFDYSFWNIGANSNGLRDIQNLNIPIDNRFLSREEIGELSKKLDFTLILYDKDSYTLSCSASIMESILYMKPIIYLDNSCINSFNEYNIGIKCDSVEELINCIVDIIKYPSKYKSQYNNFMNNILKLRNELDLDNRINFAL